MLRFNKISLLSPFGCIHVTNKPAKRLDDCKFNYWWILGERYTTIHLQEAKWCHVGTWEPCYLLLVHILLLYTQWTNVRWHKASSNPQMFKKVACVPKQSIASAWENMKIQITLWYRSWASLVVPLQISNAPCSIHWAPLALLQTIETMLHFTAEPEKCSCPVAYNKLVNSAHDLGRNKVVMFLCT